MRHFVHAARLIGLVALLQCLFASTSDAAICNLSSTLVAFGTYVPLPGTADDTAGTLTVRCSAGAAQQSIGYTVALNGGIRGTVAMRRLTDSPSSLSYQLFIDAAHSQVWGDGTGGTVVVTQSAIVIPANGTATQTYRIYGRIPARQAVSPGPYADTVTATLNY
jgi:spore coat protein U-like protein